MWNKRSGVSRSKNRRQFALNGNGYWASTTARFHYIHETKNANPLTPMNVCLRWVVYILYMYYGITCRPCHVNMTRKFPKYSFADV